MIEQKMIWEMFNLYEKDVPILKKLKSAQQKLIAALVLTKGFHLFGFQDDEALWTMNIGTCYHIDFVQFKSIKPIDNICLFVGYDKTRYFVSAYCSDVNVPHKKWVEIKKKLPFLDQDTSIDWQDEGLSPAVIKFFDDFVLFSEFVDQLIKT